MKHTNHNGFTLVELSIVLVIIGLLIGGILVAQSMISTARTTKLIKDLEGYKIAAQMFKENYKFWPGDFSGCERNGYIGHYFNADTSQVTSGCSSNEYGIFWQDLSEVGFVSETYSGGYIDRIVIGTTPTIDYFPTDNGIPGIYASNSSRVTEPGQAGLYGRRENSLNTANSNTSINGFLKPGEAYQVDQKIDDGHPGLGTISVSGPYHSAGCVQGGGSANNYRAEASTIEWDLNTDVTNCVVWVWLDS